MHDVLFEGGPVELAPRTAYTISALIDGPNSPYGVGGREVGAFSIDLSHDIVGGFLTRSISDSNIASLLFVLW